jgi:hypothetical protein
MTHNAGLAIDGHRQLFAVRRGRLIDVAAPCDLLANEDTPEPVVAEVLELPSPYLTNRPTNPPPERRLTYNESVPATVTFSIFTAAASPVSRIMVAR